jgi:probable phosphoglycerate mutase
MTMQEKRTDKAIFLVRHAESTAIDQQKRYLGQQDPELSPLGIHQAKMLCQAFTSFSIQAVFTSDLVRAANTASLIARDHNCRLERIKEFRELSLGTWEGRTFQEIQAQYTEEYEQRGRDIANYRTPGGESFFDLQKRALPAFMEVTKKTKGDIVIVAHAGVNRVILCHLMQRPLEELFSIPQDHAAVNIIRENKGNYCVVTVNMALGSLMSFLRNKIS